MQFPTRRAILFLVPLILAICAMSAVTLDYLISTMIEDLYRSADLLAVQIFEQMQLDLANGAQDPPAVLTRSAALRKLLDSTQAFGQGVVSASIVGTDGKVIVSAQGESEGRAPLAARPIEKLRLRGSGQLSFASIHEFWTADVYALRRPVFANGHPLATISIGVTTALIADRMRRVLLIVSVTGVISVLVAWVLLTFIARKVFGGLSRTEHGFEKMVGISAEKIETTGGEQLGTLTKEFNELSRRVRSERAQLATRDHLFDVVRSIQDAIVILDEVGSILFANPQAVEIVAPGADKIEGKRLSSVLGDDHRLVVLATSTMRTGVETHDVTLELADGTAFLVTLFKLGRGRIPAGLLVVLRDLATVIEVQTALDYANRLARLGALIAGVAHQLRSPLHAMNLRLELLRTDRGEGKDRHIDRLRQEVERLDKSIDALLRFLRPEKLKITDFDVNQLLRELGPRVRAEKVRIEYRCASLLPAVHGDRTMLGEAFSNVLNNAVQAMPAGGVLTIQTRADAAGIEVTIADTGVGIEQERLARIFDLYYTTKPQGSGLGLSLALRAIELNRGTIKIESHVAQGTVCRVNLPVAGDQPLKEAPSDAA